MNIYIPNINFNTVAPRELFILTRPFLGKEQWTDDAVEKDHWHLDSNFTLVDTIAVADLVLLPFCINYYFETKQHSFINEINTLCQKHTINAYGIVSGDFGVAYPEFSNITYFRMGGFKPQLSEKNKGFPVPLSDHFQRLFVMETIIPNDKNELPTIGFCGHATQSTLKRTKELAKCIKENVRRLMQNPFRKDWEPLFASAYQRAKLLKIFEKSSLVKSNFIYRNHYRAGAQTEPEMTKTTLEYYQNIKNSDYILCIRGAGNFSVRFYETLMMGKTPVFVNTDCLLPFEDQIHWKQHVVWVEWKDRQNIAQIVSDFHQQLSHDDFIQMQLNNRHLWKSTLSVRNMIEMISKN